jgi:hypothetical protein
MVPDDRYFFHGGFNSTITTVGGRKLAVLEQLRGEQPAWRPIAR